LVLLKKCSKDIAYDSNRVSLVGDWYGVGHLYSALGSNFFPVSAGAASVVYRVARFDTSGQAILSALVLPELLTSGDPRHLDFFRPQLWVALPTFLFAIKTRSLGGAVIVGMLLFWMVGKLI
jgi:branched-subunit amino acid transport protein